MLAISYGMMEFPTISRPLLGFLSDPVGFQYHCSKKRHKPKVRLYRFLEEVGESCATFRRFLTAAGFIST